MGPPRLSSKGGPPPPEPCFNLVKLFVKLLLQTIPITLLTKQVPQAPRFGLRVRRAINQIGDSLAETLCRKIKISQQERRRFTGVPEQKRRNLISQVVRARRH